MDKITPTHNIVADGRVIPVMAFEGEEDGQILMTAEEFQSYSISDWTLNSAGELEFQGSTSYPFGTVELLKL